MKRFIFLLIVFALPFSTINLFAANPVDSVLQKRNSAYQDYKAFKESMKERTWLNLINLNFKIEDVVKIDDKIIEIYLPAEINKNIELSKQLTELNNEFELLKQKNIEQQNQLKENNDKIQILIIALGFTSLLFIIFLILFINKFLRHKKIQPEINKIEKSNKQIQGQLKTIMDEVQGLKIKESELKDMNEKANIAVKNIENEKNLIEKELADLKESNEKYILAKDELDKELVDLKQEKINLDISTEEIKEKLDIEMKTRKQIEDELRKLLDELKGN